MDAYYHNWVPYVCKKIAKVSHRVRNKRRQMYLEKVIESCKNSTHTKVFSTLRQILTYNTPLNTACSFFQRTNNDNSAFRTIQLLVENMERFDTSKNTCKQNQVIRTNLSL